MVYGYLLAYNAVRPALPVDAAPWVCNETLGLLHGALASLRDALAAPASPVSPRREGST